MALQEVFLHNTITQKPGHIQTVSSNNTGANGTTRNKAWVVDIEDDTKEKRELCEIPFYRSLTPIFRLMAILGLYRQSTSMSATSIAKIIYGGVVVILLWGNFVRSLAAIWLETDIPTEIFVTCIIASVWLLQCACNATICFYMCFTDKYQTFFQHFEKHCQSEFSQRINLQLNVHWLKKATVIVTVISLVFITTNTVASYVFTYGPFESLPNLTLSMFMSPFDTSSHVVVQILINISFLFDTAAWIFPISLFTVICLQLSRQFKELNKTIAKATEKDGTITKCLEMIRREHQHLCRSVGHADHIFSVIVLVELGLNLPLICFLLYEIIVVSYPFGAFMLTLIVFWLLAICTSVGIVSWFGAVLHESAHAAVHNLHDISISPGTENHRILEVCMFMAKMNGTPIAITICNLIPLTKEFILTVIGVLVTYFALVAQTI
ncbi:uncharacterized protein LOC100367002 [Saccoglossus kowalevskii]|uniref:Odorant/gustatory chemosensory receptor-like 122 n=1 Tax=Saccoglossus kowalevskii TaxID=10224 RepID=A0A0U2USP8_SACKO|nr:odorant/gustatory chemosensory receptor-like 122 [Saccoglossus kowalevskii]